MSAKKKDELISLIYCFKLIIILGLVFSFLYFIINLPCLEYNYKINSYYSNEYLIRDNCVHFSDKNNSHHIICGSYEITDYNLDFPSL